MGDGYEPELASSTLPIPSTIDLTTGKPLVGSHGHDANANSFPWTTDGEDLFDFESAAFDTSLRIDEPREDKAFIAVYGTGPSFIRDFCKLIQLFYYIS